MLDRTGVASSEIVVVLSTLDVVQPSTVGISSYGRGVSFHERDGVMDDDGVASSPVDERRADRVVHRAGVTFSRASVAVCS